MVTSRSIRHLKLLRRINKMKSSTLPGGRGPMCPERIAWYVPEKSGAQRQAPVASGVMVFCGTLEKCVCVPVCPRRKLVNHHDGPPFSILLQMVRTTQMYEPTGSPLGFAFSCSIVFRIVVRLMYAFILS